ncbi:hypothetical protein [Saccharopolyspora hattusasensis]|uniref:hypothetical protein n=1 Tax=Saccharopolyspora hattusasensis TaxID=1128679 RepID=UPI003D975F6C
MDIYVARASAVFVHDGRMVRVGAGETARAGHPYVVAHPELFAPLEVVYDVATTEPAPDPEPEPEPIPVPVKRGPGRPRKNG